MQLYGIIIIYYKHLLDIKLELKMYVIFFKINLSDDETEI